jgi:hypothetical protein
MFAFPADDFDRARLRTLLPFFLGKTDFGSELESIEAVVQDAIPVKINLPTILRLDKAIAVLFEELDNPPMRRADSALDPPPPPASVVLKLPPCLVKGIVNG